MCDGEALSGLVAHKENKVDWVIAPRRWNADRIQAQVAKVHV